MLAVYPNENILIHAEAAEAMALELLATDQWEPGASRFDDNNKPTHWKWDIHGVRDVEDADYRLATLRAFAAMKGGEE